MGRLADPSQGGRKRHQTSKLAKELSKATEECRVLLEKVAELEDEQRALRVKEMHTLHVIDVLQSIVADAAEQTERTQLQAPGSPQQAATATATDSTPIAASTAHLQQQAEDANAASQQMFWSAVMSAVQHREQEIRDLYGELLDACQQQLQGLSMVKAMCSPEIMYKVSTLTVEQLTARLSVLASKLALQVVRSAPSLPEQLRSHLTEFTALLMNSMIWHASKFRAILDTNLDILQPFEQPLPEQHWARAIQQLKLSEQQMQMLMHMLRVYRAGCRQLEDSFQHNMRRQAAHTDRLAAQLQEQQQQQPGLSAAADMSYNPPPVQPAATWLTAGLTAGEAQSNGPVSGQPPCMSSSRVVVASGALPQASDTAATAACMTMVEPAPAGGRPSAQADSGPVSLEALMEEQSMLLRRWILLGMHVGIVTACTLTEHQMALFTALSYPSIPRITLALECYLEQQQQQEEKKMGRVENQLEGQ